MCAAVECAGIGLTALFAHKGKKREYDTWGSRVITDLSTNQACGCLTSQIGRDVVLSTKCGRTRVVPRGVRPAAAELVPADGRFPYWFGLRRYSACFCRSHAASAPCHVEQARLVASLRRQLEAARCSCSSAVACNSKLAPQMCNHPARPAFSPHPQQQ